jgi:DNA-binding beta-propeller fold protein YncE
MCQQVNVLVWILIAVRLGVIGALIYLKGEELKWLGVHFAIYGLNTLGERVALFITTSLLLTGGSVVLRKYVSRGSLRWFCSFSLTFSLLWILLESFSGPRPVITSLLITTMLGLNAALDRRFIDVVLSSAESKISRVKSIAIVVVSEVLFLKGFFCCLLKEADSWIPNGNIRYRQLGWLFPIAILVPATAVSLMSTADLANLHRWLFPNTNVRQIAAGDFNYLAFNEARSVLYASGHGFNHILAFDTTNLAVPPRLSPVENNHAQAFAYNKVDKEIYVYHRNSNQLLVLDAGTLESKQSISIPRMSLGDVWLVWDKITKRILIASEADSLEDLPILVINRSNGEIVDTPNIAPGNLASHPSKPFVYMAFFHRDDRILIYDLERLRIVKQVRVRSHLNRMAIAPKKNDIELLIASPLDSALLRFGAESLEPKGQIKTLFGVRTLAVDWTRNLVLCGSLFKSSVEVIDLETQQSLAKYYVGPWLRTIQLDSKAGNAFVSSYYGLFTVDYLKELPKQIQNRQRSDLPPKV